MSDEARAGIGSASAGALRERKITFQINGFHLKKTIPSIGIADQGTNRLTPGCQFRAHVKYQEKRERLPEQGT